MKFPAIENNKNIPYSKIMLNKKIKFPPIKNSPKSKYDKEETWVPTKRWWPCATGRDVKISHRVGIEQPESQQQLNNPHPLLYKCNIKHRLKFLEEY